jgi:GntR family transcriptional regulator, transcriptional repressor for pyruvate dehydrogenase complex
MATKPVPPAPVFHPIAGPRAADEVIDQVAFAIRSGAYGPGDRLPSLPELARAMNVSRPIVGEALRRLSDAGVVQVRRGATGGVTVASADVPTSMLTHSGVTRPATFRALIEARRPIEIALARLAAERATDEDFAALEQANADLIESRSRQLEWGAANNAFHYAIGRAARSEVLAQFQHQILQEVCEMIDSYSERYSDPELTIKEHIETLAALRTRDPEIAAQAMDAHLHELEGVSTWFDESDQGESENGASSVDSDAK